MSRINSFKNNYSKKNDKFVIQKRRDTARETRGKRENQFNKNRDIPGMLSNNLMSQRPNKKEKARKLVEWRKKKHLAKQNKTNKKPFLPCGPGSMNKTSLSFETAPQTSRSLQNSLIASSNSNSNRNSLTHDPKQLPSSRVTRSQARREADAEKTSASSLAKPTLLLDVQELAWIPDNELVDRSLKVRRRSLRFSDIFSNIPRSPFVFTGNPETALPAGREPTILEDSVELSPISAPAPTVSRNLIGAFSLMGDETELLQSSESNTNEFEALPSVRKSSKDSVTKEPSPDPQLSGIELYAHLLQGTTEDLVSQRDRWQGTLNTLTEACDNIRSAIGNTDLLLNKKFPQYSGLIRDATDNPGGLDLETRCSDLQGFWDLILREVEGMQARYSKLIRLAENGYQAVKSTHKVDRKPRRIVPRPKKESTHVARVTRASSSSLREQIMRGRENMKKKTGDNLIVMTEHKDS